MKIEILGNSDTRSGFGAGLSHLGETNPNVVALCADLTGSLKIEQQDHQTYLLEWIHTKE